MTPKILKIFRAAYNGRCFLCPATFAKGELIALYLWSDKFLPRRCHINCACADVELEKMNQTVVESSQLRLW